MILGLLSAYKTYTYASVILLVCVLYSKRSLVLFPAKSNFRGLLLCLASHYLLNFVLPPKPYCPGVPGDKIAYSPLDWGILISPFPSSASTSLTSCKDYKKMWKLGWFVYLKIKLDSYFVPIKFFSISTCLVHYYKLSNISK